MLSLYRNENVGVDSDRKLVNKNFLGRDGSKMKSKRRHGGVIRTVRIEERKSSLENSVNRSRLV